MNKATGVAVSMLIVMALMVGAVSLPSQAQTGTSPDNTKMNRQDDNKDTTTAQQQKENHSDLDITKQIRRSIVQDESLSTYAHNVKIITQDGQVTLKGPVQSADEKKVVEAKATQIAGENKVSSELNVKQ